MSDTPETDANSVSWDRANRPGCDADFARGLERQCTLLRNAMRTIKSVAVDADIRQLAEEALSAINKLQS